jgi:hypothetical protein
MPPVKAWAIFISHIWTSLCKGTYPRPLQQSSRFSGIHFYKKIYKASANIIIMKKLNYSQKQIVNDAENPDSDN